MPYRFDCPECGKQVVTFRDTNHNLFECASCRKLITRPPEAELMTLREFEEDQSLKELASSGNFILGAVQWIAVIALIFVGVRLVVLIPMVAPPAGTESVSVEANQGRARFAILLLLGLSFESFVYVALFVAGGRLRKLPLLTRRLFELERAQSGGVDGSQSEASTSD